MSLFIKPEFYLINNKNQRLATFSALRIKKINNNQYIKNNRNFNIFSYQ